MIKKTQINDKVREVLNRRINALKRLNTEKGVPFFDSNALEPQDRTNPLEQHLYRSCFAKVSIPSEILNDETEVITPKYLSSYMNLTDDKILEQTDVPLSFFTSFLISNPDSPSLTHFQDSLFPAFFVATSTRSATIKLE